MDRNNATTGLAVVLAVVILLVGYGIYRNGQSNKNNTNQNKVAQVGPKLNVTGPSDNSTVAVAKVTVSGNTDKGNEITVDDQQVAVDSKGYFSKTIALTDKENFVFIKARSGDGRETVVERKVDRSDVAAAPAGQGNSSKSMQAASNNSSSSTKSQSSATSSAPAASGTPSAAPGGATSGTGAAAPLGRTGTADTFAFLGLAAIGAGAYQHRRSQKQLRDSMK